MSSRLSILYKELSGLQKYDIDVLISNTKYEDLPKLYKKLIWNIQRGTTVNLNNWIGKSFAEIICGLSIQTNISEDKLDRDRDNRYGYYDWRINKDLEFAHEYIKDCDHIDDENNDEIYKEFLIREIEEDYILVDEDDRGRIMTDNTKNT